MPVAREMVSLVQSKSLCHPGISTHTLSSGFSPSFSQVLVQPPQVQGSPTKGSPFGPPKPPRAAPTAYIPLLKRGRETNRMALRELIRSEGGGPGSQTQHGKGPGCLLGEVGGGRGAGREASVAQGTGATRKADHPSFLAGLGHQAAVASWAVSSGARGSGAAGCHSAKSRPPDDGEGWGN